MGDAQPSSPVMATQEHRPRVPDGLIFQGRLGIQTLYEHSQFLNVGNYLEFFALTLCV